MRRRMLAVTILSLVASGRSEAQLSRAETAAIDSLFMRFATDTTPGCVAGVMRDGTLVFGKGYGAADISAGRGLTPTTKIGIASLTKPFTAAVVAMLVQSGRINADADIREYIPELPIYDAQIRVRDLIYQTSGLRDYLSILELRGQDAEAAVNDAELLRLIARQRNTNHEPGTAYAYSNTNYYLLGEVVRRVTGLSLRDFADRHLFQPLGMSATTYALPGEPLRNASESYRLDGGRLTEAPMSGALSGDGGMYTTLEDLARWDAHFIRPVLTSNPAAYVRLISENGVTRAGVATGYGWGNQINEYRGLPTHGHGGTWAGYRVQYLRFPTEGVGLAVLCNQLEISPFQLIRGMADVVLRDRFTRPREGSSRPRVTPPPPATAESLDSAVAAQYLGDYWSEDLDVRYRITRDLRSLVLREGFGNPLQLRIAHSDTLEAAARRLMIQRNDAGQVTGFILHTGRVRNVAFDRIDGPTPKIQIPRGRPIKVDGVSSSPDEWTDAREVFINADTDWLIPVRVKHDGANLLFGFFNLRSGILRVPEIVIDTKYDKTVGWNDNDWWFHASGRDCVATGMFNDYSTCILEAREWSATNVRGMTFPAVMEVRISMRLLGLTAGDTVGIAFNVTDTRAIWKFWPAGAQLEKPASWAEAAIQE